MSNKLPNASSKHIISTPKDNSLPLFKGPHSLINNWIKLPANDVQTPTLSPTSIVPQKSMLRSFPGIKLLFVWCDVCSPSVLEVLTKRKPWQGFDRRSQESYKSKIERIFGSWLTSLEREGKASSLWTRNIHLFINMIPEHNIWF
jgi:hypothetical protein